MANQELIEIVRKGRRALAKWRRQNPDVVLDLVDADLSEAKLAGANLRRGDLTGADLSGARLVGTNLSGADLTRANLAGADLTKVNLASARLFRATLKAARLERANLTGAILQGADLTDTVLIDCSLVDAVLAEADLAGAELQRVNLANADLDRTNFERVRCGWTNWTNLDLSRATGLGSMTHLGPGSIGLDTLERSAGRIPAGFLRGNGVSEQWSELYSELEERTPATDTYFIVYGEQEESFAGKLHNTLQKHGVRCWLDPRRSSQDTGISGNVPERGIRAWDRVLLCATRASLSSEWVDGLIDSVLRREETVLQDSKQTATLLWPMNLDGYLFSGSWKHAQATEIGGRVIADFTGWRRNKTKFLEELKLLIERLKEEPSGRMARKPG